MNTKLFLVVLINESTDPAVNLEHSQQIFTSEEDARQQLDAWKSDEINYAKEEGRETAIVVDNEYRFYMTWSGGNEGVLIDLVELEITNHFTFRKLSGWTHDLPALVQSLTDFSLYFRDSETGNFEVVEDSIDFYEDRDGAFFINANEYDEAIRQINEHDAGLRDC